MYTVDASVWVNAFDQREPDHLVSRQFLEVLQVQALPIIVPNVVLIEVAGAISRTRRAPAQAQAFATAQRHQMPRLTHHADNWESRARVLVAHGTPLSVRIRLGRPNSLNTRVKTGLAPSALVRVAGRRAGPTGALFDALWAVHKRAVDPFVPGLAADAVKLAELGH
jgi:hypothetical protein